MWKTNKFRKTTFLGVLFLLEIWKKKIQKKQKKILGKKSKKEKKTEFGFVLFFSEKKNQILKGKNIHKNVMFFHMDGPNVVFVE